MAELMYPCPCCGYLVFAEPPGSFSICPFCFWEDDAVQLRYPEMGGGANKVSLIEGQKNFAAIGVSEGRFREHVRKPENNDPRDLKWRMIAPEMDNFEKIRGSNGKSPPYPKDMTQLYYWRDNYWLKD